MVSANYVAVSVLSPFLGRLGDIFGRRNILIAGNSFAAIGCIISATAQSVNAVIGGVVLIGIGSAGHQVAWGVGLYWGGGAEELSAYCYCSF